MEAEEQMMGEDEDFVDFAENPALVLKFYEGSIRNRG